MLEPSWEKSVDVLVNTPNTREALVEVLRAIVREHSIDLSQKATVAVGRDTRSLCAFSDIIFHGLIVCCVRPSGPALLAGAIEGIRAGGGECHDHGLLTTPQLHYIVRALNTNGSFGTPTEEGYYEKLGKAFSVMTVRSPPPIFLALISC